MTGSSEGPWTGPRAAWGPRDSHHSSFPEECVHLDDCNTWQDAHGRGWRELQKSGPTGHGSSGPFCWFPTSSCRLTWRQSRLTPVAASHLILHPDARAAWRSRDLSPIATSSGGGGGGGSSRRERARLGWHSGQQRPSLSVRARGQGCCEAELPGQACLSSHNC